MIVDTKFAKEIEIVNAIEIRKIVCAFHDINGTNFQ